MAGRVIEAPRVAEYTTGKTNTVTAITEVKQYAVAFTDGDGKRSMALVLIFGKDAEDGGPGVFTMANEAQMSEQLRIAHPVLKKAVRSFLQGKAVVSAADIPSNGGVATTDSLDIDVGEK